MRNYTFYIGAALLGFTGTPLLADDPKVVTDIAPVAGLVASVMGNLGDLTYVTPQNASPHHVALTPSSARAMSSADLVFWVSPDLTPWFEDAVTNLAPNAMVVGLADLPGVVALPLRQDVNFAGHDHDHEHHKASADAIDPHYWLDPDNAALWVEEIARRLGEIDPENTQIYRKNSEESLSAIKDMQVEIDQRLSMGPKFVVSHDSLQYFENAFDVEAVGAISLGDAAEPGPAQVAEIQKIFANTQPDCLLQEVNTQARIIETVIGNTETPVVEFDPLGILLDVTEDFYPQLMREIGTALYRCTN